MGRPKSYQRDKLLEICMTVFWEKGYFKTSMADLTVATGVDKKCLFREFVNKERLFEEVLELYSRWDYQYFDTLFKQQPLGLDNIKKFLSAMQSGHANKGCLLNKSIVQRNLISDKHFAIIKKTITHLEQCFLKNLQTAKINHELKNDCSPEELAKYLIYTTQGILTMSNYENNHAHTDMVLRSILASL